MAHKLDKGRFPPVDKPECPIGAEECAHLDTLEALNQEVRRDALTGLYNYRHFSETLDQEVERSRRSGLPLSLVMVDLDHFKKINDQWGHEAGNKVLKTVAEILLSGVRRIDTVCRYGGEELVLILPGAHLKRAANVAERLRETIQQTSIAWEQEPIPVTASLGVAVYPSGEINDAPSLIESADRMLYQAKETGRNQVCHPPLSDQVPETQVSLDEKKALLE